MNKQKLSIITTSEISFLTFFGFKIFFYVKTIGISGGT